MDRRTEMRDWHFRKKVMKKIGSMKPDVLFVYSHIYFHANEDGVFEPDPSTDIEYVCSYFGITRSRVLNIMEELEMAGLVKNILYHGVGRTSIGDWNGD